MAAAHDTAMDVLKPYLVLACLAFVVGFAGYWMLGQALAGYAPMATPIYEAPVSTSLPLDTFGAGKRI